MASGAAAAPRTAWCERAPAKVTLSLHVLGLRDDAHHELEALTIAVDGLGDEVVNRSEPDTHREAAARLEITGPYAAGAPSDGTNLAARAWSAAGARYQLGDASITLTKNIPSGAGLGGGSADAAAVLRVVAGMAGVECQELSEVAATLGSDVPFCLDQHAAWMRGRGEILEPVTFAVAAPFVILTVPVICPTASVYQAWDALEPGLRRGEEIAAPEWIAPHLPALRNDLTNAALNVVPELKVWIEIIEAATALRPLLLGSGSSFALFPEEDQLATALESLAHATFEHPGLASYRVGPLSSAPPWDH